MQVELTVNGEARSDDVEPRLLLAHYLREMCGLTATNTGCDTTSCGACTVLVDGESVKSCTVLTVQASGSSVTTLEGLSGPDGELHPMARAFREQHGLQCGFCTPGMVMASVGLLSENPHPTEQEVREGLEGNLCRCTGYHNIVAAVLAAADSAAASGSDSAAASGSDSAAASGSDSVAASGSDSAAGREDRPNGADARADRAAGRVQPPADTDMTDGAA